MGKDQIKAKFSKKICHNTSQKFGISENVASFFEI